MMAPEELRLGFGLGLTDAPNPSRVRLELTSVLRVTAALCFAGHGAWGVITKAAWVPFFTCVGLPEAWAWKLMPVVGTLDLTLALLLLWAPRRAILIWMTGWAVWTACLRPLSGQTVWEVFERGGNFGPPFVLLLLAGPFAFTARDLFGVVEFPQATPDQLRRVERSMRYLLALLLFGHAGFGLVVQKPMLLAHWASIGLSVGPAFLLAVGAFELLLAAGLLFEHRLLTRLVAAILVWKLCSEFLYFTSGPALNIFEWVERWGDYGLPLALLYLRRGPGVPR